MTLTPEPTSAGAAALTRRGLLAAGLGAGAAAVLTACTTAASNTPTANAGSWVAVDGGAVRRADQRRHGSGITRTFDLTPAPHTITLGSRTVQTWAYGASLAPVLRVNKGDRLHVSIRNQLPTETTVHWHGIRIRDDMDGVPQLTQSPIRAGTTFTASFLTPDAGTYWFHPHVGTQLDRGLYGALIVDDPNAPAAYDEDWVVVLDDWLDGIGTTPDQVLAGLRQGMRSSMSMPGMNMGAGPAAGQTPASGSMLMGAKSQALGGDAGDVYYPAYLINGHPSSDPASFTSKPGARARIRFINAGADTAFRVAVGGHPMTITHTDGQPVQPVTTTSALLGMGERLDVLVTLQDGVFPLLASAEGKSALVHAIIRTGSGAAPRVSGSVPELQAPPILSNTLAAAADVRLTQRDPARTIDLDLTGGMGHYNWSINHRQFTLTDPMSDPYTIRSGERVRLRYRNTTMMWHPMHLHGHTFQIGSAGARKDTVIVRPGSTVTVDFDADNPGRWLTHCHNLYHGEAGMMAVLAYAR